MCYCDSGDHPTTEAINQCSVPDDAFTCSACWKAICRERGYGFSEVDPDAWSELCAKRGYLFRRQNPRGF